MELTIRMSPCLPTHHAVGYDDVLALVGDAGLVQVLNLTLQERGGTERLD